MKEQRKKNTHKHTQKCPNRPSSILSSSEVNYVLIYCQLVVSLALPPGSFACVWQAGIEREGATCVSFTAPCTSIWPPGSTWGAFTHWAAGCGSLFERSKTVPASKTEAEWADFYGRREVLYLLRSGLGKRFDCWRDMLRQQQQQQQRRSAIGFGLAPAPIVPCTMMVMFGTDSFVLSSRPWVVMGLVKRATGGRKRKII